MKLTATEYAILKAFKTKAEHCNLGLDETPLDPCDFPSGVGGARMLRAEKKGLVAMNMGYMEDEPPWFELTPKGLEILLEQIK